MFCHHIHVLTTERKPQNLHIHTPKYPFYQENVYILGPKTVEFNEVRRYRIEFVKLNLYTPLTNHFTISGTGLTQEHKNST
jgi:hypothetical protein